MILKDGKYSMHGINPEEMVAQWGEPLYVYDANKILSQYQFLKNAFKGIKLEIKYACKANTNINILRLLKGAGSGIDTVSLPEVQLAIKAGFDEENILYTPNCVSYSEIKEAIKLGVRVNIDNIPVLEQFGHDYGNSIPVCIRINPHIVGGGNSNIQTGHIDSKFGISIHQMRHTLRVIKANNIHIEGLHMHTGSDILDADVFIRAAEVLFDLAHEFPELTYLDFGSGFKVAYKENDVVTNVQELGGRLVERIKRFYAEYGRELQIWFEPGKYLVSESGYLLVRANVVKQTVATVFVGVNSGMNHLMRPMLYDAWHDITNVSNPDGPARIYTVVGYICETDTFGWDRKLNEVREGDLLAIHNAGAYAFSMSSNYNSRFRPAEVLIHNGQVQLIRERETLEDILSKQIELEDLK